MFFIFKIKKIIIENKNIINNIRNLMYIMYMSYLYVELFLGILLDLFFLFSISGSWNR